MMIHIQYWCCGIGNESTSGIGLTCHTPHVTHHCHHMVMNIRMRRTREYVSMHGISAQQ